MDTGDIVSSIIATVSLIATASLAYRQTRMQARLTAIEETRRREQAPAALRPGDRLPFPVLTLAETAERVQVVVSWKDDAGPHRESFTVQLP